MEDMLCDVIREGGQSIHPKYDPTTLVAIYKIW